MELLYATLLYITNTDYIFKNRSVKTILGETLYVMSRSARKTRLSLRTHCFVDGESF